MVTHYKLVKTSLTENVTAMNVSDRNERARLPVKSAERGCLKNEVGGPAPTFGAARIPAEWRGVIALRRVSAAECIASTVTTSLACHFHSHRGVPHLLPQSVPL